jgi:hypothetical protein
MTQGTAPGTSANMQEGNLRKDQGGRYLMGISEGEPGTI